MANHRFRVYLDGKTRYGTGTDEFDYKVFAKDIGCDNLPTMDFDTMPFLRVDVPDNVAFDPIAVKNRYPVIQKIIPEK